MKQSTQNLEKKPVTLIWLCQKGATLKAFDILKNIINIIQQNLKITVYETFSPRTINIPINEKFLTIEIYSGSENKTLITITSYTPQS